MRHSWPFVCLGTGREMYGVELYAAVRLAVVDEGLSHREAARRFGIDPRTVKKMPSYAVPPGYWRTRPVRRPKLEGFTGIIDAIPEARRRGIGYITPASGGSSKRNPVVGVLGVRHQNSAVLSPTAGVFPHPVQPFTQRHERSASQAASISRNGIPSSSSSVRSPGWRKHGSSARRQSEPRLAQVRS